MKNNKRLVFTSTTQISLILFAVFFVSGLLTYKYVHSILLEHVRNEVSLKVEMASSRVQNIFENAAIHTTEMGINPVLVQYLKEVQNRKQITEEPLYSQVIGILKKVQLSNSTHFLVWVANEKANFYVGDNEIVSDYTYEANKRPWYEIAVQSRVAELTPPYLEWGTDKLVLSSILALRNPDNSIYGFVAVDVALDSLPNIMSEIRLTNKDLNFMIAANGTYVYHPQSNKVMNSNITDASDPLQSYSKQILTDRRGFLEINYNGKPMYLTYSPGSETGWIIVSLIDKASIGQELGQVGIMLIVLFLLGFIFVLLGVSMTSKYNRPSGDTSEDPQLQKGLKESPNSQANLERNFQDAKLELAMYYHHIMENEKIVSLGKLVPGVTHEVNTPLGISVSTASYMSKLNQDNRIKLADGKMTRDDLKTFMEDNEESLRLLTNNLSRASEIIKNFKQVAVDQSTDIRTAFNLKENIDVILMSLKHEYKQYHHQVINNCPSDIVLDSYPGLYSQIFTNFIMNSIHHGFKDIQNGQMTFDCDIIDQRLIITYTDNGAGISPENLEYIFDMFFTTNPSKSNNGLGMHIVKNLITERLKGTIVCSSKLGQGVTFVINVPLILD